jgi:N-acetyl-gamma-glutamyl-phosphate reductase
VYRIGIINVTGYIGMEAARLLAYHPEFRLTAVTGRSAAGKRLGEFLPHLGQFDLTITEEIEDSVDAVISALPHAASAEALLPHIQAGTPVADLSADFRLKSAETYAEWYGREHPAPQLLADAVYGLPELHRDDLRATKIIATPGCYPTASILALAPAMREGLIEDDVIVDAKSGISGAGRGLDLKYHYAEANESVSAYGLSGHRHQPEIGQELGLLREAPQPSVTFVPHLIPMTRGILATCYAKLRRDITLERLTALYEDAYATHPFTKVHASSPGTKLTYGTNLCLLHPTVDQRAGRLVVVAAIDNLVKGGAGQAIQCLNLVFGLPEETGLRLPAVYP